MATGFLQLPAGCFTREQREDRYLWLPKQAALGVKIREGRLELKYRLGTPQTMVVAPGIRGKMERWEKFALDTPATQTADPGGKNRTTWISVRKNRLVTLFENTESGPAFHALDQEVTPALQVEYTELEVEGISWSTLGLEWLSETGIHPPFSHLSDLLKPAGMDGMRSMGYPEFLQGLRGK